MKTRIKNYFIHIKNYLIHLLGGYTKEDYNITVHNKAYDNGFKYGFKLGISHLAIQLENIAIRNYGCSKQEWIDKIYTKIKENL